MKKEDLLSDEFLKQFKTGEDLYGFLAQLQKRGLEKMLEGELDAHFVLQKTRYAHNGFFSIFFEQILTLLFTCTFSQLSFCAKVIRCIFAIGKFEAYFPLRRLRSALIISNSRLVCPATEVFSSARRIR